jgi:hypothetical protein
MRQHGWARKAQIQQDIDGAAGYINRLEEWGWLGFIISFKYRRIDGPPREVAKIMEDEVKRVYSTLVTRIVRDGRLESDRRKLPVLLCVPDYPVYKKNKKFTGEVLVNGGRHMQGELYIPPVSRLRGSLKAHFRKKRRSYIRSDRPLIEIHVKPIRKTPENVTDYIFKSVRRGRVDRDDVIVLPESVSELRPKGVSREAYYELSME